MLGCRCGAMSLKHKIQVQPFCTCFDYMLFHGLLINGRMNDIAASETSVIFIYIICLLFGFFFLSSYITFDIVHNFAMYAQRIRKFYNVEPNELLILNWFSIN